MWCPVCAVICSWTYRAWGTLASLRLIPCPVGPLRQLQPWSQDGPQDTFQQGGRKSLHCRLGVVAPGSAVRKGPREPQPTKCIISPNPLVRPS